MILQEMNEEKQREILDKLPEIAGHTRRRQLLLKAMAFGAIQCPCGHVFESKLGKYGCPNCEGESVQ